MSPETSATEVESLERAADRAAARLLAERDEHGAWTGELSTSALSTATAVCALALRGRAASEDEDASLVVAGARWLAANANEDGGFGDAPGSPSNVSTTCLAWAALSLPEVTAGGTESAREGARGWLERDVGPLSPGALRRRLEAVYGEDRTFAVPILTLLALVDPLGAGPAAFRGIPALPFELAALPSRLFHLLGLPVVSYAMPALIAIGQVLHARAPSRNPLARGARNAARARTLRVLERIQPSSGGFLEATPLTSFVALSLVGSGLGEHPVTRRALAFLRASARVEPGGARASWPIDTDLATWLTSLAVDALAGGERLERHLGEAERERLRRRLADQQTRARHPYTNAAAGAWAWTDLPGGVPDADDTAGALVALARLGGFPPERAAAGVRWLLDLQNRDGGIPTFCRGWGRLPFDRSSSDLTAHALRAWHAWRAALPGALAARHERARERAVRFLVREQRPDGSWIPLWFGNQEVPDLANPTYGTSRVLKAAAVEGGEDWRAALARGRAWLLAAQGTDGGWGGAAGVTATVEETALALDGLVVAAGADPAAPAVREAVGRGARWLAGALEADRPPSPIGLYFARLWYSERLYPVLFATAALERARTFLARDPARGEDGRR